MAETKPRINGSFAFEGNAAQIIFDKKAEYLLKGRTLTNERAIKLLLCEAFERKYKCGNCGE